MTERPHLRRWIIAIATLALSISVLNLTYDRGRRAGVVEVCRELERAINVTLECAALTPSSFLRPDPALDRQRQDIALAPAHVVQEHLITFCYIDQQQQFARDHLLTH